MALLKDLIVKEAETLSKKVLINAAGTATATVISAASKAQAEAPASKMKDGILYVKPSRRSEDYIGQNASTMLNELLGCGFEKVELKPNKTLGSLGAKNYGKVKSVSINGKTEFGQRKVPATVFVIIEYQAFKDSVDRAVYEKVKEIKPGIFGPSARTSGTPEAKHCDTRYCTECGAKIEDLSAKFCSGCGKKLE